MADWIKALIFIEWTENYGPFQQFVCEGIINSLYIIKDQGLGE